MKDADPGLPEAFSIETGGVAMVVLSASVRGDIVSSEGKRRLPFQILLILLKN